MYNYSAVIERVIDGDTVDVILDLGFFIYHKQRVRMAHINAPEKNQTGGKEATDWLMGRLKANTRILVTSQKPHSDDKYGRFLADIYLLGDTVSVNQEMLNLGLATAYEGGAR